MTILEVEAFEDLIYITFLTGSNPVIGSLDFNTKDVMSVTKIFAIKLSVQVIFNRLLLTIFLVERSLCHQCIQI
jgi:hypothetical protein